MNAIGIIPARFASTRLPGKPLEDIHGKPMIQWVYERASTRLESVYVATDDERILSAVHSFGGKAIMTQPDHVNGSSRCWEAFQKITADTGEHFDVILNIQGDEPMIEPKLLSGLVASFENKEVEMATLVSPVRDNRDLLNESEAFVVMDKVQNALYFSRSVIPFVKEVKRSNWLESARFHRHLGLYAYSPHALKAFQEMEVSALEMAEGLEQNRWLENGRKIRCVLAESQSIPVDTLIDLERVRELMSE